MPCASGSRAVPRPRKILIPQTYVFQSPHRRDFPSANGPDMLIPTLNRTGGCNGRRRCSPPITRAPQSPSKRISFLSRFRFGRLRGPTLKLIQLPVRASNVHVPKTSEYAKLLRDCAGNLKDLAALCRATNDQPDCRQCPATAFCGTPHALLQRYGADFLATPEGLTTAVSETGCDLLKRPERDSLGMGWREIVHPVDVPTEMYLEAVRNQQHLSADYRILNGDGKWVWISAATWPIYDPFGRHLGSAGRIIRL